MPRPLRILYSDAMYHVMNRGACREPIFLDLNDRLVFLEILSRSCSRTDVEVHAYCLMGNHFHLLVMTPNANLDVFMRLLSGEYARYFNDKYGRDGGLCRGRYKSILIDTDAYLLAVSRYIHRNPFAFWDEPLADYTWSSYPAFLGIRPPQVWLETKLTLGAAGGRSQYESAVMSRWPSDIDHLYKRSQLPSVIGSKSFREEARAAKIEKGA